MEPARRTGTSGGKTSSDGMTDQVIWPIAGGLATGLALGLTGGGGTLLALPVLSALGATWSQATAGALTVVALLAGTAALVHWRTGRPRLAIGFAGTGMIAAPLGAWAHGVIPAWIIAALFAVVALAVAVRLWRTPVDPPIAATPACRLESDGQMPLTPNCLRNLATVGAATGLLSGLTGAGGGVLAVPALIHLSNLDMRSAVATSLLATALIAGAGAVAHAVHGEVPQPGLLVPFLVGGLAGLGIGSAIVAHLPAIVLRRSLALLLLGVVVWTSIRAAGLLVSQAHLGTHP